MAPPRADSRKRKQGESSSSGPQIIVNPDAFPQQNILWGKILDPPTLLNGTRIYRLLDAQGWLPMLRFENKGITAWIREFYYYVNLDFTTMKLNSQVKSKELELTASIVARAFGIPNQGTKLYSYRGMPEGVLDNLEANVIEFLWEGTGTSSLGYPKTKDLTPEKKLLFYILHEVIIPREVKDGSIPKFTALLMYLMYEAKHINLPHIIINHIIHTKEAQNQLAYGVPLTHLFESLEVPRDHEFEAISDRSYLLNVTSLTRQKLKIHNSRVLNIGDDTSDDPLVFESLDVDPTTFRDPMERQGSSGVGTSQGQRARPSSSHSSSLDEIRAHLHAQDDRLDRMEQMLKALYDHHIGS